MSEIKEGRTDQSIIIENRARITVSGVTDVLSFDDETVSLETALGRITVKGEGLRISGFNTETGDLTATGKIHAAVYTGDAKSGGFISRMLK